MRPTDSNVNLISKKDLQNTFILLRKTLPFCIIVAFFLAKFTYSPVSYDADITIIATGQTSSKKPGSAVVWLASPGVQELGSLDLNVEKSDGWETRNGIFISTRNQPATMHISGFFRKPVSLRFIQGPYSGVVEININGFHTRTDLFSTDQKVLTIDPMPHVWRSHSSTLSNVLEFVKEFAANLLILLFFFIVMHPVLNKIPPLKVRNAFPENASGAAHSKLILLISLFVLALFLLAFYPGVMIYDSYEQYWQAIHFWFVDWHPPVMALLWSVTDKIIKGSGGMLVLQVAGSVYSFCLLSRVAERKGKKAYWVPLLALFLPMISCCIFFLIKDVSLAVSLLLAFSLWYFYHSTGKWSWPGILLILLVLFYSAAVRKNSLPAVLPLLSVLFFDLLASWKKAFAFSVLLSFFFYIGNEFLVYHVLQADRRHPFQVIMMHDLMGIYDITHRNYVPDNYLNQTRLDEAMKQYDHRISARTTVWNVDWFISYDDRIISELKRAWLQAIRQNSIAYLTHRWILFKSFLTDLDGNVNHLYAVSDWHDVMRNLPPPLLQETALGKVHTRYVNWVYRHLSFLFKAYFSLIASFALLFYALKRKVIPVMALASSSLIYCAPYFFVAPSVNYRYIYWPVVASVTSLIVMWIEKDSERK